MTKFVAPTGHEKCKVSMGMHDFLTFGSGELSPSGFWENPCWKCARAYEKQFPDQGPCWPHKEEDLKAMGFIVKAQGV
jgi:hypothetical protein